MYRRDDGEPWSSRMGARNCYPIILLNQRQRKMIRKEKTGEEEKVSHGLVPPTARLLASDWMQIRN
jgi:hypothetical protein